MVGSYGEEERPRLDAVRDQLVSDATPASADDDVGAFLMDEILDISEFFTSKFKLLVSYADHIVGVYEHSKGGHPWEAGYIDQPTYRDRTRAFYRTYETDEAQYEAYDGMFAHYLLSMVPGMVRVNTVCDHGAYRAPTDSWSRQIPPTDPVP